VVVADRTYTLGVSYPAADCQEDLSIIDDPHAIRDRRAFAGEPTMAFVVASAFRPSLAAVGAWPAVAGYLFGTYRG